MNALPLVPGRECGKCHACCRYTSIPALGKAPNILCEHWKNGCTIYAERPDVCRGFFCAWRVMPNLDNAWRPDRSKIFLRITQEADGRPGFEAILLGPLTPNMTRELLSFIAEPIREGLAVYLALPGPPGHGAAKLLLNNRMREAFQTRSYEKVRKAFEEAQRVARAFETQPIPQGPPEPKASAP
jgi:Fe-S-cluster containining protein